MTDINKLILIVTACLLVDVYCDQKNWDKMLHVEKRLQQQVEVVGGLSAKLEQRVEQVVVKSEAFTRLLRAFNRKMNEDTAELVARRLKTFTTPSVDEKYDALERRLREDEK